MRVSNSMISHNLLSHLGQTTENLLRLQEQMASGLKINRPSDDPMGAVRAAAVRSALAEVAQYQKNAEEGKDLLAMTDSALAEIVELVRQARDSGLAGVTGTSDAATREALARNVEQMLESIVRAANSDRAGRFLFGGYKTNAAPFSLDQSDTPPVTYSGDSGAALFEVGRSSTVAVNLAGDQVFNMNGAAEPGLSDLFSTLDSLKDSLLSGDAAQMQTSLDEIDQHLSHLLSLRAEVGARGQGIELALNRLSDTEFSLKDSLSRTEDADLAKAVVELQAQQNIYQATAAIASVLAQMGLLEFLR